VLPGAPHVGWRLGGRREYVRRIVGFFREHLGA
jgi:hypothetical protein